MTIQRSSDGQLTTNHHAFIFYIKKAALDRPIVAINNKNYNNNNSNNNYTMCCYSLLYIVAAVHRPFE